MRVILLEKILNLGILGDQINVKPGYARNFLFPKRKAVPATKINIKYFETQKSKIQAELANSVMIANHRIEEINKLQSINILTKAGKNGKLFGSIGTRDIARAITEAGVIIKNNEIYLPNGNLRKIGMYEIEIKINNEMRTTLIVNLTATK